MSIAFKVIAVPPQLSRSVSTLRSRLALTAESSRDFGRGRLFSEESYIRGLYLGCVSTKHPDIMNLFSPSQASFDQRVVVNDLVAVNDLISGIMGSNATVFTRFVRSLVQKSLPQTQYSEFLKRLNSINDNSQVKLFIHNFVEILPLFSEEIFRYYNFGPSLHQVWRHVSNPESALFCSISIYDPSVERGIVHSLFRGDLKSDAAFYAAFLYVCNDGDASHLATFLEKTNDLTPSQVRVGGDIPYSPGLGSGGFTSVLSLGSLMSSVVQPNDSVDNSQQILAHGSRTVLVLTYLLELIKNGVMTDSKKIEAVLLFLITKCTNSGLTHQIFTEQGPLYNRIPLTQLVSILWGDSTTVHPENRALFAALPDPSFSEIFSDAVIESFSKSQSLVFKKLFQRQIAIENDALAQSESLNEVDFPLTFSSATVRLSRTISLGRVLEAMQDKKNGLENEIIRLRNALVGTSQRMVDLAVSIDEWEGQQLAADEAGLLENDLQTERSEPFNAGWVSSQLKVARGVYQQSVADIKAAAVELAVLEGSIPKVMDQLDRDGFGANALFRAFVQHDRNLGVIFGCDDAPVGHDRARDLSCFLRNIRFETDDDLLNRIAKVLVDAGYLSADVEIFGNTALTQKVSDLQRQVEVQKEALFLLVQSLKQEVLTLRRETQKLNYTLLQDLKRLDQDISGAQNPSPANLESWQSRLEQIDVRSSSRSTSSTVREEEVIELGSVDALEAVQRKLIKEKEEWVSSEKLNNEFARMLQKVRVDILSKRVGMQGSSRVILPEPPSVIHESPQGSPYRAGHVTTVWEVMQEI